MVPGILSTGPRGPLRLGVAVCLGTGVLCQFVQDTDPVFPLSYFTVDSALLAGTWAVLGLLPKDEHRASVMVRGAAAVGVIVSGLIYATVIAPATPTGTWFQPWDDPWVRTSTVLLHGIGPLLVTLDYIAQPISAPTGWRIAGLWCAWPLSWLAVMATAQNVGIGRVPYPFLQPDTGGGLLGVAAAVAVLTVIFLIVGRLLQLLRTATHRLRHREKRRQR